MRYTNLTANHSWKTVNWLDKSYTNLLHKLKLMADLGVNKFRYLEEKWWRSTRLPVAPPKQLINPVSYGCKKGISVLHRCSDENTVTDQSLFVFLSSIRLWIPSASVTVIRLS